jgi:hypothetical protein
MLQRLATATHCLVPPGNGEIRYVDRVSVSEESWQKALLRGAPETKPDNASMLLGKLFSRPAPVELCTRFVLMWPGKGSKTTPSKAQEWGRMNGLRETHPYEIFALSEAYPCLYEHFKLEGAGLAPTQSRPIGDDTCICGVWQSTSGSRWATLVLGKMSLFDRTIFVFGED